MRAKHIFGRRRLISFFLTTVLLFGMLPSSLAQASSPEADVNESERIVPEPAVTEDGIETVVPEGESPATEETEDLVTPPGPDEGTGDEGSTPEAIPEGGAGSTEGDIPVPNGEEAPAPSEDEVHTSGEGNVTDIESVPPVEGELPLEEIPPAPPTDLPGGYPNSISGSLWLDTYQDADSGIIAGDGIRQAEEAPLSDFSVCLYLADDRSSPVQTATTNGSGYYQFKNMEPGTYLVGICAATIGDVEYLIPIAGNSGDNRFGNFSEEYDVVYSSTFEIVEDTVVDGIDAGMRTPPPIQPSGINDYDAGDVAIIEAMAQNNGLIVSSDPDLWSFVTSWKGNAPNKKVRNLNLNDKNLTGILNLSGLTALEKLDCNSNSLTGINVSGCTALVAIGCANNNLESEGLTLTNCFSLQRLACENNNLKILNVSGLTSLYALSFTNNNLTTLNIKDCTGLFMFNSGGNPDINTITLPNGDTIYLQSNSKGRIQFVSYNINYRQFSIQAIPNNGETFHYWNAVPDVTYVEGSKTSAAVSVVPKAGVNTTITPSFNPRPKVMTLAATNLTTSYAQLNASYDLHGASLNSGFFRYSKNAGLAEHTEVPFDLGYTDTGASTALSGLTANTKYYYKAFVAIADGAGEGEIKSFVTLPEFRSWSAAIAGASKAVITGQFEGTPGTVSAVTITYGNKSDLSDGISVNLVDRRSGSSGEGFGTAGVYHTLTGLTGLGSTTPWYVKITLTNESGTTTSEIRPIGAYHTVTIKYLDKDGGVLSSEKTHMASINDSYPIPLATISKYKAVYYRVNGGGRQDLNPSALPSIAITADTTIIVYYASTMMSIAYPVSGMSFAALHTDGGNVTSASYEFENRSDLPVRVSFKQMSVTNAAGLSFVSNAAMDGDIHLNLAPGAGGSTNGFTSGINNVSPGSYANLLGTLDGEMVGNAGTNHGYLTIGGHYEGPFTITPKLPELEFMFNFILVQ